MKRIIIAISFLLGVILSSRAGDSAPMGKVKFLPHWLPQAQFAGYYMAEKKGIYKKYGIDVEILKGGPEVPPFDMLNSGKADFTTNFLATALKAAMGGDKIVNIGQFSKKSALVYVTKKKSGIMAPSDMNGKKLGIWKSGFREVPLAFNKKYGIDMRIVPILSTPNLFLLDGVDVMTVMWYNEYHTILNSGLDEDELTDFFFYNSELNIPEDGVYCLQKTLTERPEVCEKFIKASIEGWKYAFAHRDETIEAISGIMREAHVPANKSHQRWMLDRMNDLFTDGSSGELATRLNEESFKKTLEILSESGVSGKIDFVNFHRDCGENVEK